MRQLESGRALVLIDGLDEMPQEHRETVRLWIDSLVAEYPDSRFVITSRPYAAEEGWLTSEGFLDAELQDMTTPDVHAFIGHWHKAVKEGVQTIEEKDELDDLSEALLKTVKSNRSIHRLATSPLLCAMLCALHRDRVKNLPADRIELYRACIDMFFRRDTERKISLDGYPELGDRQKRTLLGDLAFWLIRNNLTMADEAKADERLEKSLRSMGDSAAGITGIQMRRLFVERSGILRQPEPGHIDFPHRTFQEYLAAHAAVVEGCVGELIENAHRDQWREVVILAAGLASEAEAEQLVLGVINRGDTAKRHKARFFLLAVACSELAVRFPEGSQAQKVVTDRIKEILPPKKIRDAKELAAAGDVVVPFLEYNSYWTLPQRAACVRTLVLIGSEVAYAKLVKYRQTDSHAVWTQILSAIHHTPNPDELLHAFEHDTCQSELISFWWSGSDTRELSALAGLTTLRMLHLGGTPVSDVPALAGLTRLQTLFLSATPVSDVSALAGLISLQTLYLGGTRVSDVSALAGLTSIQKLSLRGTQVSDVSALAGLTSLQTLDLSGTRVSDLSALAGLNSLQTLDLGRTPVTDVSALASLPSLQTLHLWNTQVSDVSALDSLVERGLKIHR